MRSLRPFSAIIFLLLSTISLSAQTVFPETGRWEQKYHSIAWGHGGEVIWDVTEYHTYASSGTTVINNQTFTLLNLDGSFDSFIQTDGLKVYRGINTDSLQLFFDFGLNPGDTFRFPAPNYSAYPYELLLEVVSVDSVHIGGETRRRIRFSDIPGYGPGPLWIQGIGDVNFGGIETDYSFVAWYANTNSLECFLDNGIKVYGLCTVGTELEQMKSKLWPNPCKGALYLQLDPSRKPVQISVFLSDGRLVKVIETVQLIQEINLDKGVYLLKINESGRSETVRVISL